MPQFPFNPAQFEYAKAFEKLPAGFYPAVIFESEILATAAGTGFRLVLKYKIIDGPGKDRILQSSHNTSFQTGEPQLIELPMTKTRESLCKSESSRQRLDDGESKVNRVR